MENTYYIVSKKEMINGVIIDTPVGYFNSAILVAEVNVIFDGSFTNWINTNKQFLEDGLMTMSEYFVLTPYCYSAYCTADTIRDDLQLLTNTNTLI